MVEIRPLGEDDVEGICALWIEFAKLREDMTNGKILNEDAEDYFFGYATGLLHKKGCLTLVAVDGDEVVGYLIASTSRKPPVYLHTKIAYLSDAYVSEKYRGQGILKRFVATLEEWAVEEGLSAIDVMLFASLTDAQEVYRHLGFENYRMVQRKILSEE